VPGLLREKTLFLLKGLPKNIRKQFIPLNNTVDLILDSITSNQGSYYHALERALLKMFSKTVRRSDWPHNLPQHLLMRFELFDQEGKVIASGRNLADLVLSLDKSENTRKTDQLVSQQEELIFFWKDHVVSHWEFSGIPERIDLYTVHGNEIAGFLYPAVRPVPESGGVTLCFEDTLETAQRLTTAGMSYLYRLQFTDQFKALKRFCTTKMTGPSSLWLTEGFGGPKQAVEQLLDFIVRELFNTGSGAIHNKQIFTATVADIKTRGLYQAGMEICETVLAVLRRRREVKSQILRYEELSKKTNTDSTERKKEHLQLLEEILPANFLELFDIKRLSDCDRYLRGLSIRVERAHVDYSKEESKKERLAPHLHNYEMFKREETGLNKECLNLLREFETLINEFRISLFSPEIGTKISVSEKKLAQHWRKMNAICLFSM
jgi:ATP-dependent helicase HrpA